MTDSIAQAVSILRAGGLVAFPTETVYGLGADATNAEAIRRIFAAKGRPSTNPLIVHIADERAARRYAAKWPASAEKLATLFWPGPLTLVLPRALSLAPAVSAGRDTVGLRAPDHPLAGELLRAFDGAIAAPSANRSNHISPTTADHVRDELGGAVDLILDGGPCRVGIESTVLDLSVAAPTILRPGSITRHQIESALGRVEIFTGSVGHDASAASPGQHATHYAPTAAAYRFTRDQADQVAGQCRKLGAEWTALLLLGTREAIPAALSRVEFHRQTWLPPTPMEYSRLMYAALRALDVPAMKAIFVEMPPDAPKWTAVRDRLIRATKPMTDAPFDSNKEPA
ncbi:MAG TPA: L-threonylcarbamoyladenylate synthase [Tepidisphaeraceae bacterium]|jgi:L-threonylcarbamoyladenylate synthase|nr:L-threonylcarbamoyladenylate synthase [Tepidisphaeraceae bacterium]